MIKIKPENVKYTTPEGAYNAGELWYKKKLTNTETCEEFYQVRPIFMVERNDGKMDVSVPFLYKFFQKSEICVMLRNGALDSEIRYIYRNGVYNTANDSDIMRILMKYIEDYNIRYVNPGVLKQALELNDCTCEHYMHDVMNTDEDYINFQNGILNIRTMKFSKHTPKLMSSIQIPCQWSGVETPTPVFDSFLDTLTGGNKQTQLLILEYMGAILSNVQGWRFKKAMFLLGEGDTGKSTLINLITLLLGSGNVAERDLRSLNERFGKTAAYNKRLIYSNDLPFMKIEENAIFKNLTGGDTIAIEYKNKEPFDFKFKGLLLYGMNSLPHFGGDKGEHVYNRIIIVRCDNVIPKEKKDPNMEKKLYAERNGIIYKCVVALREAINRNYRFSITQDCIDNLTEYKKENSTPVEFWSTFLRPLTADENPVLSSQKLYDNFRRWCTMQGITRIPSAPEFRKEVSNYCKKSWSKLTKRTSKGMQMTTHTMNKAWENEYEFHPEGGYWQYTEDIPKD
ncbi:MAG: hypothetical protein E7493_04710 [Ruminococcus albus]|nr:hypothetical protein [Ruminococcus albus]